RTGALPESAQGLAADPALDQPEDVPTAAPTQVPTDTPEPSEPPAAEVSTAGVGETSVPAWPFILAVAVIAPGFLVAFERRPRAHWSHLCSGLGRVRAVDPRRQRRSLRAPVIADASRGAAAMVGRN